MTCIGNSGPLPEPIANAVEQGDLVVASVLSGNRNFEGRINPHVKANYLASPPLVVAYALAGTVDINLMDEPVARNDKGEKVYLKDIWPTQAEVNASIAAAVKPEQFQHQYANVANGNEEWNRIRQGRRTVQLRGGQHLHPGAAVLYRPLARAAPHPADQRCPRAGDGRRQRDDRPHLPRRRDQEGFARR
jgi:aconitase A